MRILFAVPLLLLGACQVTEDKANDQTTIEYNSDVAEQGAADVANTAGTIAGQIATDVEQSADKVSNKVGDIDVDVDVNRNKDAPATNTN